jgi:hypothetical protein
MQDTSKVSRLAVQASAALNSPPAKRFPEGYGQKFAEESAKLVAGHQRFESEKARLVAERELTPTAEARLQSEYIAGVAAVEGEVEKVLNQFAAVRQRVLTVGRPSGEGAVIAELRRREVRDALRSMDPVMLRAKYVAACRDGSDDELQDAIELAPSAARLLPPDVIEEGRSERVRRLAPITEHLENFAQLLTSLTKEARRLLDEGAETRARKAV